VTRVNKGSYAGAAHRVRNTRINDGNVISFLFGTWREGIGKAPIDGQSNAHSPWLAALAPHTPLAHSFALRHATRQHRRASYASASRVRCLSSTRAIAAAYALIMINIRRLIKWWGWKESGGHQWYLGGGRRSMLGCRLCLNARHHLAPGVCGRRRVAVRCASLWRSI